MSSKFLNLKDFQDEVNGISELTTRLQRHILELHGFYGRLLQADCICAVQILHDAFGDLGCRLEGEINAPWWSSAERHNLLAHDVASEVYLSSRGLDTIKTIPILLPNIDRDVLRYCTSTLVVASGVCLASAGQRLIHFQWPLMSSYSARLIDRILVEVSRSP